MSRPGPSRDYRQHVGVMRRRRNFIAEKIAKSGYGGSALDWAEAELAALDYALDKLHEQRLAELAASHQDGPESPN